MEKKKDRIHSLIKVFAFIALLISAEIFVSIFKPAMFTIVSKSEWGISFTLSNIISEVGLALVIFFVVWLLLPKLNGKKVYVAYLGAYILAVATLVVFSILERSTLMTVIQVPISLFFATMAVYCAMEPSEKFFTFNIIAFGISAFLVSYIFALIAKISLGDNFVLLLMIYLYIAVVVKNQNKMDDVFVNQAVEKLSVSKKMRAFNFLLLTLVFSSIAILYFFVKDYFLMIAPSIIPGIISMVRAIIKFINKIFPMQTPGGPDGMKDTMVDPPPGYVEEKAQRDYTLLEQIFTVVLIILILLAIFFIFKYGIKAIRKALNRLKRKMNFDTVVVEEEEDYTDIVEEMEKEDKKKGSKRESKRIVDNRPAIRKLYSKILNKWNEIIDVSDTPDDIMKKIEGKTGNDEIQTITNIYQNVRYGEKESTEEENVKAEKIYKEMK